MKSVRTHFTYSNVMSSIAVFLILGGATAFAANQLGKKTVGAKQLKVNAVTTAKIKKEAVSKKKIKKNAVDGSKVKDGSLTGSDINLSTLGTVPSANVANNLAGLTRFNLKLGFGQSQDIVKAGVFTLTAKCLQNTTNDAEEPGKDVARIVISTSANGKVFDAWDAKRGEEPTEFLETTTPENERVWTEESVATGEKAFEAESNSDGAAFDPNGASLSMEGNGVGIGINVFGPGCFFNGYAIAEG
jgi:hypothetical protein